MDINTLRGIATILAMVAFLGVCWWAFSSKRKKRFEDAAQLPFADEPDGRHRERHRGEPRHQDENEER